MGTTRLDLEIERRERQLQSLKALKELRDSDPELFEQVLGEQATQGSPNGSLQSGKWEYVDKIKFLFVQNNNRSLTIPEIITRNVAPKGAIYRVMYRSAHKTDFKKRRNPKSGLVRLWKLTDEAYEDAKERLAGKEVKP